MGLTRTDARHAAAVTASDTGHFEFPGWVYVGGTGNVAVLTDAGETVTFNSVPAGSILPILVRRVNNTDTTATNMTVMW